MKNQKKITLTLVFLGLIYFCAMIPANRTGAANAEMLSVFEVDEYAQYSHVLRMLTPGETTYQSLRNFFVYLHYFYGFPFYFFSAISLLPLKLLGAGWQEHTRLIVCWLRMMVSVLPMILACGLLTWVVTHFRKWLVSVGTFLFLLMLPAVLQNNFWWHPDSLSLFFLALVFFFLDRDQLEFGRFFYLAAAACGYAVGIKYHGLFFGLAILVYLGLGVFRAKMPLRKVLLSGVVFIIIFVLFIIVSNPLLLLPQERAEIIQTQKLQFQQTGTGVFTINQHAFLEGWNLPRDIRTNYADTWFFILAFGGLLLGVFADRSGRTRFEMILSYLILAVVGIAGAATSRLHYFLPVALPLLACFAVYFDEPENSASSAPERKSGKTVRWIFAVLFAVQLFLNMRVDRELYQAQLTREQNAPAIQFYDDLAREILPELHVGERKIRVFRDWKIYFPESEPFNIQMDWDMATLAKIEAFQPDLILLEQANLSLFSQPDVLTDAVNPAQMEQIHAFYQSAAQDELPGYRRVKQTAFASVYQRTEIP